MIPKPKADQTMFVLAWTTICVCTSTVANCVDNILVYRLRLNKGRRALWHGVMKTSVWTSSGSWIIGFVYQRILDMTSCVCTASVLSLLSLRLQCHQYECIASLRNVIIMNVIHDCVWEVTNTVQWFPDDTWLVSRSVRVNGLQSWTQSRLGWVTER